jgi:uncharacterized protein YciI
VLYALYLEDDMAVSKQIRTQRLEAHLAYLDQHRDIILLGGALLDEDGSTRTGSLLVLNVKDRAQASDFAENEPFRKAGLYASARLTRMRRAQWYPENAPGTADG